MQIKKVQMVQPLAVKGSDLGCDVARVPVTDSPVADGCGSSVASQQLGQAAAHLTAAFLAPSKKSLTKINSYIALDTGVSLARNFAPYLPLGVGDRCHSQYVGRSSGEGVQVEGEGGARFPKLWSKKGVCGREAV